MPTYHISTDIVGEAFEACWRNANSLIEAAQLVAKSGNSGLALSLSVLAMEEVGKMFIIDGLIFAIPGDERSKLFETGFRKHKTKLLALDMFPLFLNYLTTFDDRNTRDKRFTQALIIVIEQYRNERMALAKWIGKECNLEELDAWKQRGFYVHDANGSIVSPSDIDKEFSRAVLQLAERMVDAINFILKESIKEYRNRIKLWRTQLSDEDLMNARKNAQDILEQEFGLSDNNL